MSDTVDRPAPPSRSAVAEAELFTQAIRHARLALCLADPRLPDNPIVFANEAFSRLTGYATDEVIGRNCRFLQGEDTDGAAIERIRAAIRESRVDTVELVNYRKDGSRFVNALQIGPIYDVDGRVRYYFGSQLDVTDARAAEDRARQVQESELRHRLMNMVAVLSTIVRLTGQEERDPDRQNALIRERIRAVGEAHVLTLADRRGARGDLQDVARVVLGAYARNAGGFTLEGPKLALEDSAISTLALVFHELATNAVKHGALGAVEGKVSMEWEVRNAPNGAKLHLTWREEGGPLVEPPDREGGSGILKRLLAASGGSMTPDWRTEGLVVSVELPMRG